MEGTNRLKCTDQHQPIGPGAHLSSALGLQPLPKQCCRSTCLLVPLCLCLLWTLLVWTLILDFIALHLLVAIGLCLNSFALTGSDPDLWIDFPA